MSRIARLAVAAAAATTLFGCGSTPTSTQPPRLAPTATPTVAATTEPAPTPTPVPALADAIATYQGATLDNARCNARNDPSGNIAADNPSCLTKLSLALATITFPGNAAANADLVRLRAAIDTAVSDFNLANDGKIYLVLFQLDRDLGLSSPAPAPTPTPTPPPTPVPTPSPAALTAYGAALADWKAAHQDIGSEHNYGPLVGDGTPHYQNVSAAQDVFEYTLHWAPSIGRASALQEILANLPSDAKRTDDRVKSDCEQLVYTSATLAGKPDLLPYVEIELQGPVGAPFSTSAISDATFSPSRDGSDIPC